MSRGREPGRAHELVGRGEHRARLGQRARRRPRRRARARSAVVVVAVSKAKIVVTLDRDAAVGSVDVGQGHGRADRRQPAARVLGPLDERNRAIEVGLEVAPLLGAEPGEPVEVEVRDRNAPVVAVPDRERRARHRRRDAERAAGAADERRLPRAELAGDRDDVARLEPRRRAAPPSASVSASDPLVTDSPLHPPHDRRAPSRDRRLRRRASSSEEAELDGGAARAAGAG